MTIDFTKWIGKTETRHDHLRCGPADLMAATLGQSLVFQEGDTLPPLWHWLYFLDALPPRELGRDGHPKKGGFLPPVALPRRMWAGGRFEFLQSLRFGSAVEKRSSIVRLEEKTGRSGPLCFVTVRHTLSQHGQAAVIEDHDIVYREDPDPNQPVPAPAKAPESAAFSELVQPDPVLLFRYSALMFNGHRIHYDVDYARDVEGYDGLVFHGPLTATLLVDLATRQAGRPPNRYEFRGVAPISGNAPFHIEGRQCDDGYELWAKRADGALAMRAQAFF
ncbi:MaoC family dehydratase N-terminal domain-containing protein [uncultured Pelagimonas sp.]|uniref:FAS1-like dehydratase domain-containing protein n=1 Tax=uncultured Pelagimonas sp. TaxID=1618102 RepID=UPI0026378872|nr:MaoC family dehydratase N-terminal domain-containing protein [uncultured Pelagimonas sp.]